MFEHVLTLKRVGCDADNFNRLEAKGNGTFVTVIDENGRIFGKVNVIDLLVVSLIVGLIPLVYGAFLLFRTPGPQLYAVTPPQLVLEETSSIRITGANLSTNLRVRIGGLNTESFLVESQTAAEVGLPENVTPGTYDVILLDEEFELGRLANALTIEPSPEMTISSFEPMYWLAGEPGSLRITGERLEPYLTARLEPHDNGTSITAVSFLLESDTKAEIKLPLLPDGSYDLVLTDAEGQEQARSTDAFTVIPGPSITSHGPCQGDPCLGDARAVQGSTEYLDIEGEHFESYMRVHFEPYLSIPNSVVYESPEPIIVYPPKSGVLTSSKARIALPELEPLTYTLVLSRPLEVRASAYDGSGPIDGPRELVRVQGLLTVVAPPEPEPVIDNVRITVRFVSQPGVQIVMSVGDQDTSVVEVGDTTNYLPNFPVDKFNTDRLAGFLEQAPEEMRQRVLEVLENLGVLSGLVAGRGGAAQQAAQASWADALAGDKEEQLRIIRILNFEDQRTRELPMAEIQSVGPRTTMPGSATVGLPFDSPGGPSYIAEQTVEVFDAVIEVPVTLTPRGWAYGEQYIKVGSLFQMETLSYAAQGWVTDMELVR